MVDEGARTPRTFVEDARRNGQFLRVTWHGDRQQFVVSNWDGDTCVGASRVAVADAAALIDILTTGLADAAARPRPAELLAAPPRTLREHLAQWWRNRTARAAVLELRRDRRSSSGERQHRRSA